MTRKKSTKEPDKAQRLSLAELAAHDDVCSDVMVDNAYYKSKIRKNRTKHIPIRGIKDEEIPKILLHKVIVDKDVKAAEKALLALPGPKRYKKSLRTKAEQEHFLEHLRKYIAMYQTDCAWEVSTTNRYTITTYEAAVTARRRIRQGDTIKYLTGTLVPLTTEESAELDMSNRNFSIVVSGRKKNSSIFLGPARFANHDCDANGRLVPHGENGMEVVAMKNIEVGDEITVSYGDDYFGPGNMDCLCHTCEQLERNGWTSKAAILDTPSRTTTPLQTLLHEPLSANQTRGLKRKRDSDLSYSSSAPPPSKHAKPMQSPSKLQQSWTPPDSSDSDITQQALRERRSEPVETLREAASKGSVALSPPHSQSRTENSESPDPISPVAVSSAPVEAADLPADAVQQSSTTHESSHEGKMPARLLEKLSTNAPMSPAPTSPSSNGCSTEGVPPIQEMSHVQATDAAVTIKVESVETTKMEVDEDTIIVAPYREVSLPAADNQRPPNQQKKGVSLSESSQPTVPHAVSTLATTTVTKEIHEASISAATENSVLPSIEPTSTSRTVAQLTVHPMTGTIRIAGDYILTRKLLAQPHDRWVQCHNQKCLGFFIQPNGYQTRRECPRCERHSMLYGFPWPKTDADPRKLLERKPTGKGKKTGTPAIEYSAYRRQGRSGKGTWVEGGGDPEERVMDHRTIHRFVLPEEEKEQTRRGLLKEAEIARAAGDHQLAILEARMRVGSHSRAPHGNGSESAVRDVNESGSATPDEMRRRSNRFVTRPVGVYTDRF
ncbi:histone-lysine N-methyltransferase SUV420H [Cladophialophora yegresii CBS 114405]|uniref:Histone-lysine N-methyltransferase SET9 n=1 Tax=Cladophialophora yegresii CBS 114405 TaxID=1182544 RepID=W9VEV0_9EURO|nr:histone-lysine N-methyltransferase SUV420H [Cladophialophora yegresii CBS 114405]EXJ53993.1 histone-lysine N-methyltransferase SUV420H [Cladophialophora yegresii CBS 114405]